MSDNMNKYFYSYKQSNALQNQIHKLFDNDNDREFYEILKRIVGVPIDPVKLRDVHISMLWGVAYAIEQLKPIVSEIISLINKHGTIEIYKWDCNKNYTLKENEIPKHTQSKNDIEKENKTGIPIQEFTILEYDKPPSNDLMRTIWRLFERNVKKIHVGVYIQPTGNTKMAIFGDESIDQMIDWLHKLKLED